MSPNGRIFAKSGHTGSVSYNVFSLQNKFKKWTITSFLRITPPPSSLLPFSINQCKTIYFEKLSWLKFE